MKRVRELDEYLAVERREWAIDARLPRGAGLRDQRAVVAIADVQDRLPIHFVNKEKRAAEVGGLCGDRSQIERRISIGGHILGDRAHEEARRERIGA